MQRCLSISESDGAPSTETGHDNIPDSHASLMPILRQWTTVKLARDSWQDALTSAMSVSISFFSRTHRGIEACLAVHTA